MDFDQIPDGDYDNDTGIGALPEPEADNALRYISLIIEIDVHYIMFIKLLFLLNYLLYPFLLLN